MIRSLALILAFAMAGETLVAQPQPPKPILEQIEDAWKARAEKVKTLRAKIEMDILYPKHAYKLSAREDLGQKAPRFVPDTETRFRGEASIMLDGTRFRLEEDELTWGADRTQDKQVRRLHYLTGTQTRSRMIGLQSKPLSAVLNHSEPNFFPALSSVFRPLSWFARPFGPAGLNFPNLGAVDSAGVRAVVGGIECEQFVSKLVEAKVEHWISVDSSKRLVREVCHDSGNGDQTTTDIQYASHPDLGWVPESWWVRTASAKREPRTSQAYKVLILTLNSDLPSGWSDLEFKPGDMVVEPSLHPGVGEIQEDGSYLFPDGKLIRRNLSGDWRGWLAIALALLSVGLVTFLLRSGFRRPNPQSPSALEAK